MELSPPLYLGVVAIEKEAFGFPSTKVTNFTCLAFRAKARYNKILLKYIELYAI